MKSFSQFIIEKKNDPDLDLNLRRGRIERKQGRELNPKEVKRLKELSPNTKANIEAQARRDNLGGYDDGKPTSVRGGKGDSNAAASNQHIRDQRRADAQARSWKKTTKTDRAGHIGSPTHIHSTKGVKYKAPITSKLPKAEQELISQGKARRAKTTKPQDITGIKSKITADDAKRRSLGKSEYSTSTQARNRYGSGSVLDSKGRWVPDPIEDGKPITEPGRSAKRRPGPSVDDVKSNIKTPKTKTKGFGDPWNQFPKKRPEQKGLPKPPVDRTNRLLPPSKKKPEIVKQSEVSDQIKNNQETRRSRKLRNAGKPTPTTVSTSNNYKRNPNPNPTPRKTDQQVMRDLEARSSSSNRKQGYSIKNDLEAIKRKRNISSNTSSSSSSSSSNNKPPEIETPLRDNQKKSFKKFKSRIDSIGIDPSVEKTKTKFDKILDSSKKKEFFNPQNNNNKPPEGGKGGKGGKGGRWGWIKKNVLGMGKKKKYKGDAVSNWVYPVSTGVSAYMRERGKGSGQTRSIAVGSGRGYLDYKAARIAGSTAFKATPGPGWLKGASAMTASGLALWGSSNLGRSIENNLPLNKVQQAQVDAAKDKEEKKKQIKRQNQLRSIITPPRASLPNVPSKSQGIDFGYGFNTKGSGKSR